MPKIKRWLLVPIAAMLLSSSTPDMLSRVRSAILAAAPFSVRFTQQLVLDGNVELEESGQLVFVDHTRLKWVYTDPDFKVFLFQEGQYRYYNREDNVLTLGRIRSVNDKWVWQLLFAEDAGMSVSVDPGSRVLNYRDEEGDLDVRIEVNEAHLPVVVVQSEPLGTRTRYVFRDYRTNQRFGDDTFRIDMPDDVEIIDQELD